MLHILYFISGDSLHSDFEKCHSFRRITYFTNKHAQNKKLCLESNVCICTNLTKREISILRKPPVSACWSSSPPSNRTISVRLHTASESIFLARIHPDVIPDVWPSDPLVHSLPSNYGTTVRPLPHTQCAVLLAEIWVHRSSFHKAHTPQIHRTDPSALPVCYQISFSFYSSPDMCMAVFLLEYWQETGSTPVETGKRHKLISARRHPLFSSSQPNIVAAVHHFTAVFRPKNTRKALECSIISSILSSNSANFTIHLPVFLPDI